MNLFNLFRSRATAPVARDRLQILLAHERTISGGSDLVAILREEILAVIKKHISVDAEKVMVKMDRGDAVSTLEVDIEIPTQIVLAKKDSEAKKEPEKAEPKESKAA
jgi:cell division topological specificity factor